jgi:hypothetical protein
MVDTAPVPGVASTETRVGHCGSRVGCVWHGSARVTGATIERSARWRFGSAPVIGRVWRSENGAKTEACASSEEGVDDGGRDVGAPCREAGRRGSIPYRPCSSPSMEIASRAFAWLSTRPRRSTRSGAPTTPADSHPQGDESSSWPPGCGSGLGTGLGSGTMGASGDGSVTGLGAGLGAGLGSGTTAGPGSGTRVGPVSDCSVRPMAPWSGISGRAAVAVTSSPNRCSRAAA